MILKHLICGGASALALVGLSAGAAFAQDEPQEPTTVGGLVVTAQKREQILQNVPLVVNVASEQLLEDTGVEDIRDLSLLVPGLTVTATSNEANVTARIRGVGTVGDNPGLESSVGVVIDGVYRPRNGVGFGDLGDVRRIEVLKGPQGTLFGKNTSAGVISVITNEPSFDPNVEADLTVGDFAARAASMQVTGPIAGDSVAGSIYVGHRQRDGFYHVVRPSTSQRSLDENIQSYTTIRGQILALPSDNFSAKFIADWSDRDENCCGATQLSVGTQAGNSTLPTTDPLRPRARGLLINDVSPGSIDLTSTPFDRDYYANRDTNQDVRDYGISGELTYNFGDVAELTSLTAVRHWRIDYAADADFTGADLVYRPDDGSTFTHFDQTSQEFRLAGDTDRLNWLVGAFFAHEELDSGLNLSYGNDFYSYWDGPTPPGMQPRVLGGAPGLIGLSSSVIHMPGRGSRDHHAQTDDSWALFTNNEYQITDQLIATVGLRYTSDEKEVESTFITSGGSCQQAEPFYATLVGAIGSERAGKVVGGLCVPFMNQDFSTVDYSTFTADSHGGVGRNVQHAQEEATSGTLKLRYEANDDLMFYASYSRGYKGGGFNLDRESVTCPPVGTPVDGSVFVHPACLNSSGALRNTNLRPDFTPDPNTHFAPETVNSYELGVKSQWGDNLLVNATAFSQEFTDFQLNTFDGLQFIVETLPGVTSRGIDLDFLYITPITGLTVQGGVTLADTKIDNFTADDLSDPGRFAVLGNLPGQTLGFAPDTSASLALTYEHAAWNDLVFHGNIAAKYNSEYNTGSDLHSSKLQEAFTLVNLRVGIGPQDESWALELWSENLFDQDYIQVGFNGPFQTTGPSGATTQEIADDQSVYDAFLGAPRTVGVTLRIR